MDKEHPHTGATYQMVQQADGSFAIRVSIPDAFPTMVTGFGSETAAAAWVANHQKEIANGNWLRHRAIVKKR